MRILAYVIAPLLLMASLAVASAPSPDRESKTTPRASQQSLPATTEATIERRLLEQEAKHLREQNASIESYHESVLTTAYFALGTVITITVLLLGYSWWFNSKAYENDKKALRDEVASRIAAAEGRISLKEQEQRSTAEAAINARIDSATSTSAASHNQLRNEVAEARTSLQQASQSTAEKIDWISREFRMVEDMVWALRGVHSNSLLALAQGLGLCATDDDDDIFDIIAERFKKRIRELIDSGYKLSDDSKTGIVRRLEELRDKRPEKIATLLDQLNKIERDGDA
jgi:hypothetical protein